MKSCTLLSRLNTLIDNLCSPGETARILLDLILGTDFC